jgi:DNA-binding IclR family transcriptional regulator
MPVRVLKRIYERDPRAIAAAGFGKSLEDFRTNLARIRRAGHCIAHGEVDKGRIAVAAPILGASGDIQGSLTFVMPEEHVDEGVKRRMVGLISAGADEIEANMAERTGKPSGRPTTGQVRPRGAPNRRKKLVTARQQ